jgi:hypothetical protein
MIDAFFNTMWPVKDLLDVLFGKISDCYKNIDLKQVEQTIRKQQHCTINDIELEPSAFSERFLSQTPFELKEGKIGSLYIKFPMTYLKDKTEIILDNITINVAIRASKEISIPLISKDVIEEKANAAIDKIKNAMVNLFYFSIRKLTVNIVDAEQASMLRVLVYKIEYRSFASNENNLFIYNKEITFDHFIVKVVGKDSTNDDFFQLCEEGNERKMIDYYTSKDIILVITNKDEKLKYNSFSIRFEKLRDKSLDIGIGIKNIEIMMDKLQLNCFLAVVENIRLYYQQNSLLLEQNLVRPTKDPNKTNSVVIVGYPLNNITVKFDLECFSCILIESETDYKNLPRLWLKYNNYYMKYYQSDEANNFYSYEISHIQKHFNYLGQNFFIFSISKIDIIKEHQLIDNKAVSSISIGDINFRYNESTSIPIKRDLIVINNIITNDDEKYFDDKFGKLFLHNIKFENINIPILQVRNKTNNVIKLIINSIESFDKISNSYIDRRMIKTELGNVFLDINFPILTKIYYLITFKLPQNSQTPQRSNSLGKPRSNSGSESNKSAPQTKPRTSSFFKVETFNDNKSNKNENSLTNKLVSGQNFEAKVAQIINCIISFDLTIKISYLNNTNSFYTEFYNTIINPVHNLSEKSVKLDNQFSDEQIIIKFDNIEIIMNKQGDSKLYINIWKMCLYFYMKKIYFPLLIYKNNNFISSSSDEKIFENLNVKKWIVNMSIEKADDNHTTRESFIKDIQFYLNSHSIKRNENFILDDLKNDTELINDEQNNLKFNIQCNIDNINMFANYIHIKHFLNYVEILNFSYKYFNYLTKAIDNNNDKQTIAKQILFSLHLEISQINVIGFSNLNLSNIENAFIFSKEDRILFDFNELDKHLENLENIFNLLENPLIKLTLKGLKFSSINYNCKYYNLLSLDDLKLMLRKVDNIYQDISFKYQSKLNLI